MESSLPAQSRSKLVLGAVIIGLGVLFTLSNLGWIYVGSVFKLWPLILIGIGLTHAIGRRFDQALGAWLLVGIGSLFLLRTLGWLPFSVLRLWPLILVVVGVRIVLGSRGRAWSGGGISAGAGGAGNEDVTSRLDDLAFFGGVERRITTPDFRGGNAAAFCGAFDIDLRGSQMSGERAVIDVFAWWGGGEIRVPPDWNVTTRVLPILGGVDEKTVHPVPEEGKTAKQLVVTGTVVMGGLDIKN